MHAAEGSVLMSMIATDQAGKTHPYRPLGCCTKEELKAHLDRLKGLPVTVDIRMLTDLRVIVFLNGHCVTWHRERAEKDWICEEL